MREVLAWLILLAGIIAGLYVGGYLMFIKEILIACHAFDIGSLTAVLVGKTIIKCVFASVVGGLIAFVGFIGFGIKIRTWIRFYQKD